MLLQASIIAILPLFSLSLAAPPATTRYTLSTRCPRCSRKLPPNPIAAAHPVTVLENRDNKSPKADTTIVIPTSKALLPNSTPSLTHLSQAGDDIECLAVCTSAASIEGDESSGTVTDIQAGFVCFEECRNEKAVKRSIGSTSNGTTVRVSGYVPPPRPTGDIQCFAVCVGSQTSKKDDLPGTADLEAGLACYETCQKVREVKRRTETSPSTTSPDDPDCEQHCQKIQKVPNVFNWMFPGGMDHCTSACKAFWALDCKEYCSVQDQYFPESSRECPKKCEEALEQLGGSEKTVSLPLNIRAADLTRVATEKDPACGSICKEIKEDLPNTFDYVFPSGMESCESICEVATETKDCNRVCDLQEVFPKAVCLEQCEAVMKISNTNYTALSARSALLDYASTPPPLSFSIENWETCMSVAAEIFGVDRETRRKMTPDEKAVFFACLDELKGGNIADQAPTQVNSALKTNETIQVRAAFSSQNYGKYAPTPTPTTTSSAQMTASTGTKPETFYLKTIVTKGSLSKNNLYVQSYHIQADKGDAVLGPKPENPMYFLNSTYLQVNAGTPFPWSFDMAGRLDYTGWTGVQINVQLNSPYFYFDSDNNKLLKWGKESDGYSNKFGGWMVCDWVHGIPQLFWKIDKENKFQYPESCSEVELVREY